MSKFSNPGWTSKFKSAFAGIAKGVRGQNSFYVHIPAAIAAIGFAVFLQLDVVRVAVLILCIGVVLACELFNSAIENLGKSITSKFDRNIGDSLDIASGAVLMISIFAAAVGWLLLLPPVLKIWQ